MCERIFNRYTEAVLELLSKWQTYDKNSKSLEPSRPCSLFIKNWSCPRNRNLIPPPLTRIVFPIVLQLCTLGATRAGCHWRLWIGAKVWKSTYFKTKKTWDSICNSPWIYTTRVNYSPSRYFITLLSAMLHNHLARFHYGFFDYHDKRPSRFLFKIFDMNGKKAV